VKYKIILELNLPVLLSSSSCNLLEEINAISTPEKKADNKRVIIAKIKYIFIKVTK
jgi:hypothetical protein